MPRKTSVVRDGTRPKCLAAVVTGDSPTGTSSRAVVVRHFRERVRVDISYFAGLKLSRLVAAMEIIGLEHTFEQNCPLRSLKKLACVVLLVPLYDAS